MSPSFRWSAVSTSDLACGWGPPVNGCAPPCSSGSHSCGPPSGSTWWRRSMRPSSPTRCWTACSAASALVNSRPTSHARTCVFAELDAVPHPTSFPSLNMVLARPASPPGAACAVAAWGFEVFNTLDRLLVLVTPSPSVIPCCRDLPHAFAPPLVPARRLTHQARSPVSSRCAAARQSMAPG